MTSQLKPHKGFIIFLDSAVSLSLDSYVFFQFWRSTPKTLQLKQKIFFLQTFCIVYCYCPLKLIKCNWSCSEVRFVSGRHCRWQCKIFGSGVNFTHFFVFLSPKLLRFCEIKGVNLLASKSGGVKVLTNLMSGHAKTAAG